MDFSSGFVALGVIGAVAFIAAEVLADDAIRVRQPITPRIELVVENNVVDTVYVYEKP